MTLPLQLDAQPGAWRLTTAAPRRALLSNRRAMVFIIIFQYLTENDWFNPRPEMPGLRQILPSAPRLVAAEFAVF
jgi:hypothetical protein